MRESKTEKKGVCRGYLPGCMLFVGLKDNFQVRNQFSTLSLCFDSSEFFVTFLTSEKKVVFNIELLLGSKYVHAR